MRFIVFLLIIVGFSSLQTFAQNNQDGLLKNAVYAEPLGISLMSVSLNYERLLTAGDLFNISLRGGFTYFYVPSFIAGTGLTVGGPHNFGDLGVGINTFWGYDFKEDEDAIFYLNNIRPIFYFGYRYQGKKGLLLKATPYLFNDGESLRLWPGGSVGYAF